MRKTLGCTGGIGSGKSYVCRYFTAAGIPVYDSDSRTKDLYGSSAELLKGVCNILGDNIIEEGALSTKKMADIIFHDAEKMQRVREFVYPFVMRDFGEWREEALERKCPFVVLESAVILESDYVASYVDKVLVVTAPLDLRIKRICERYGSSAEEAYARIASQISDKERTSRADYIITSIDGSDIKSSVDKIIREWGKF